MNPELSQANRWRGWAVLILIVWLFLAYGGSGLSRQFTRGADVAGWTASTAANSLAIVDTDRWLPYGVGRPLPELEPLENLLYLHQSPLPYWLTAAAFSIFGVSEKVARWIPLAFTLGAALLFFRLLKRLWSAQIATVGLGAFLLNPATVTFAMSNNHIVIAQFTVLLALLCWIRYSDGRGPVWPAFASTFLAMWTYWDAYFLPLLFAYWTFADRTRSRPDYRLSIAWLVLPIGSIGLHLALYFAAYHSGPYELLATALQRSGASAHAWTPVKAIRELALEIVDMWHVGIVLLGIAFLTSRALVKAPVLGSPQKILLVSLGALPLLYWICMPKISTAEPMFNMVLIVPFVSLCFALGAELFGQRGTVLAAAVIVLSVAQIASDHDKWQHKLYASKQGEIEIALLARGLSKDGDVIFEHHTGIGPGVVAYYARGRAALSSDNFLLPNPVPPEQYVNRILRKLRRDRSVLLLTAAHPEDLAKVSESLRANSHYLHQLAEVSEWRIFRIDSTR